MIKNRDPVKVRAGSKDQSGKDEGPRDEQRLKAIAISFREEEERETIPGDQVAQWEPLSWKEPGVEGRKGCPNATLLCVISLHLTNSAGASGKEPQVTELQGPAPWTPTKQRG